MIDLEITHDDGVLRLHLNRPDKRNALNDSMVAAMIDSIEAAGRDEAVRVIVISGAGDHFCSGFDIVSRNAGDSPRPRVGSIQRRLPSQAHRLVPLILTTQTPVVCRVQGWCAGIGLNLALAADFAVATDDARFWMPFVDRGFTADSGATWLLPRRIGEVHAREMLLAGTGRRGVRRRRVGGCSTGSCLAPSSTRTSKSSWPSSLVARQSPSGSRSGC